MQFGTIKYGIQFRANPKEKNRHRGESSASCSDDDGNSSMADDHGGGGGVGERGETHMCPRCQEQFQRLHEFLVHKRICDEKAMQLGEERMHSDPEDMVVSGDEEMDEPSGKLRRHRQDAENNNSLEEEPPEQDAPPPPFPFPVAGHVTLEALQNTKVAVAQFAATAMANNADNETALQDLAVLQSTLFTLQHQQVFQLQLIQQLQNQLSLTRRKEDSPPPPPLADTEPVYKPPTPGPARSPTPPPRFRPPREPTPALRESTAVATPAAQNLPATHSRLSPSRVDPTPVPKMPTPSPPMMSHPPYSSISSSLASSIITNNDPPPSLNEPNTLEMLQKRAQEVLDNASQGLLANNLADELAFRKSGKMSPYDGKSGGRNEPFFKHRCRYCGKVFGSDSALQIHIRSHTGERPFKCNVCGSRFTTKGNLKVHFQRHTSKFPHVKMNPNPIPEHLDKYHPPILSQLSPGPMPGMPPHPLQFPSGGPGPFAHGMTLYRPPHHDLLPPRPLPEKPHHPLFTMRDEQDAPADLSKPASSPPSSQASIDNRFKSEPQDEESLRDSSFEDGDRLTPKREPDEHDASGQDGERDRYPTHSPYDDCSTDSKYSNEDQLGRESPHVKPDPDQPENLSSKNSPISGLLSVSTEQRAQSYHPYFLSSPPSSASSSSIPPCHIYDPRLFRHDPTRDPMFYNLLLPRPGSNDNSWESLIEITKSSENSKLQQIVDNLDNKISDPNQCVVCQRVLSCKSALQMHYRTHTGERPFRCRLCGRAFTTKGNLKTHMGVHRIKPPTRLLHQCPVCHKKFTNSPVLQQHIRLHTGEPTDLSFDQIRAAEVEDGPSRLPPGSYPDPLPFLSFPGDRRADSSVTDHRFDDDSESMEHRLSPFSASASENDLKTVTTTRSVLSATGSEGARSARDTPPSPLLRTPPPRPPGRRTPPSQSPPTPLHALGVLGGSPFSPLGLALGSAVRGNTTCNICYKTFACHSALEIHYRSHTKERPFKCTVCDRGFSTKSSGGECRCRRRVPRPPHATALNAWNAFVFPGNMKQHMLTHKIRDMPPAFDKPGEDGGGRGESPHERSPAPADKHEALKRSPPALDLPTPKRPSVGNAMVPGSAPPPAPHPPPLSSKHLCGVCRKNFSSSSALQIHMRTHTGDKPFRCAVCQKAFTTKGNLKVHMGTHMWSSGASRRGRRMSLELPPRPLQEPHDLLRRPDLFYPYLPAPFLNGMQQKLNEISVIQQGAGGNGLGSPGAKFPGLLGFGAFPPPPRPGSPLDRPPSMEPRDYSDREALAREFAEHGAMAAQQSAMRELAERGRAMLERSREQALREMEAELQFGRAQEPPRAGSAGSGPPDPSPPPPPALPLMAPPARSEGLTV